ncbi:helix-turn-helix transcriptional regulator [uncultured Friedmanniella sp.]|uniref:helix-turn-helix transcriptional regulator n=1 Tax=uncultured Friedmanniella sp. TaxID=335381 RepID=UPI0035CB4AFB
MSGFHHDLAEFLRRARSKVDPGRTSLPPDTRTRRVPGLRREEVAMLAGVSTDYYTRLEQGRKASPSAAVVEAIARALDLDEAERLHLDHLVGPVSASSQRRHRVVQRARPSLHQFLEALGSQPAFVTGRRGDVLATNKMARALLVDFDRLPAAERNYTRWLLLDDSARALFVDWAEQARNAVHGLRLSVGDDPDDRATADLVNYLATSSAEFRGWWDEHSVYQRTHGTKRLHHPVVGALTIAYETLTLPGDPDQALFVYTTEAGTSSREALDLLASWTLSPVPVSRVNAAGERPA